MPYRDPTRIVCDAWLCTCSDTQMFKTILPNGTHLEVALCRFHGLELEETPIDVREVAREDHDGCVIADVIKRVQEPRFSS